MNDGSRWMKHFFIIAGGKIEDAFAIEVLKGFAEKTVIAADSGMEFLRRNEIVPQVIIGDFDSVSKETLEWFQKKEGIVWHRLNPQKDDTDTEFALRLAISMGAECITVLGGTGSRLDHVLGNIELLGIGLELGVEIELLDANNRIRMTDHGMVLKKEEQFGKYVSLIPYTAQVEHLYLAGFKYPLADYELMPDMAIIDAELMMNIPKGLTSCSGIDALSHSLEAVASVMASDFTNGIAKEAIKLIFEYLPDAYSLGSAAPQAREKMANAASMAGMAFANAFLGVCHSMAHKLGAYWHLPHGMANSLLLEQVIRFNSAEAPAKMGTFPQYAYPDCKRRYAEVARYVGCKGKTDDELVESFIVKMKELQKTVGQPETIREAIGDKGTEEEFLATLEKMSEDAFDDQCTGANPRYPLVEEIKKMYLNAYYGKHESV